MCFSHEGSEENVRYIFYLAPQVFACQPALRHFHLSRQVLLQRSWEEFPSDHNVILTWPMVPKVISMWVEENLSSPKQHLKWIQPASHWPLYLFHQLAQTYTLTSWLGPTLASACYAFSAVGDIPPYPQVGALLRLTMRTAPIEPGLAFLPRCSSLSSTPCQSWLWRVEPVTVYSHECNLKVKS